MPLVERAPLTGNDKYIVTSTCTVTGSGNSIARRMMYIHRSLNDNVRRVNVSFSCSQMRSCICAIWLGRRGAGALMRLKGLLQVPFLSIFQTIIPAYLHHRVA